MHESVSLPSADIDEGVIFVLENNRQATLRYVIRASDVGTSKIEHKHNVERQLPVSRLKLAKHLETCPEAVDIPDWQDRRVIHRDFIVKRLGLVESGIEANLRFSNLAFRKNLDIVGCCA